MFRSEGLNMWEELTSWYREVVYVNCSRGVLCCRLLDEGVVGGYVGDGEYGESGNFDMAMLGGSRGSGVFMTGSLLRVKYVQRVLEIVSDVICESTRGWTVHALLCSGGD